MVSIHCANFACLLRRSGLDQIRGISSFNKGFPYGSLRRLETSSRSIDLRTGDVLLMQIIDDVN